MVDRHDIDALLISALYGELTPADEARLQTHLDSHPADKTALADLTLARNAVRESRILTVQLEPPQAVSALLLQEAARRAPKLVEARPEQREGWFQRFVRSFAAHPAMAAAAMLVIVLGVASTMYVRGRTQFADQTAESPGAADPSFGGAPGSAAAVAPAADPATITTDVVVAETKKLEAAAGSAFEAHYSDDGYKSGGKDLAKAEGAQAQAKADAPAPPKAAPQRRKGGETYLSGDRLKAPQPMDLDSAPAEERRQGDGKLDAAESVADEKQNTRGRNVGAGSAAGPGAGGNAPVAPVVSDSRVTRGPATSPSPAPPPPPPASTTANRREADETRRDEDSAWAKSTHDKVTAAVKASNCKEASALAVSLSTRAPGYYASNVENDMALKKCAAYINAERDREAERAQRARVSPKAAKPAPAQQRKTTSDH
ncbi:MAG: hypothetical protein ABI867_17970 [Kofleriaceae bacterium]